MATIGKLLLAVGAIVAAIILFVVLRPDEESSPTDTTAAGDAAESTTTAPGTTDTGEQPPAQPQPVRVNIRVRGGTVPDIQRVTVEQGRRVVIVVTADIEDEVHLHGYDLMRDVVPGEPTRIAFRATIPGRFEVELEDRKLPLAEIEVEP